MRVKAIILSVFVLAIFILDHHHHHHVAADAANQRELYIVYMGELKQDQTQTQAIEVHQSMMSEVVQENISQQYLVHSFGRSFDGFVAYLLPEEVTKLEEKEEVVSVFPNTMYELHTTETWDYLGLNGTANRAPIESDTIVGLLDTGIYMQCPSFNDTGFGPPPTKWKGKCDNGTDFPGCNNKVIGARSYSMVGDVNVNSNINEDLTPADYVGHGSHTSSTAAGSLADGASYYGIGKGTARGGVPSARIAMYKVCEELGCPSAAILAAFDDAIADGVDVLSVSLGGRSQLFTEDVVAIGSFHAMKNGILTSCSAGNQGHIATLSNGAPWILTVAASFGDRVFKTPIKLGDNTQILGDSLNPFQMSKDLYPLIDIGVCNQFAKKNITGQIVLCVDGADPGLTREIKDAGAAGLLMTCNLEFYNFGQAFGDIPCACITREEDVIIINKYINSTKDPQALIEMTTSVIVDAPTTVAFFSSRGPDTNAFPILKPDIAAPGANILAGYSEFTTDQTLENKTTVFNVLSGTSMSCPHASAAAAYVKTFHPDWSPAAIKSALITTAKEFKPGVKYAELSYGSGQINPVRAIEPGLIYDLNETDYLGYLCQQGYNSSSLQLMSGDQVDCSNILKVGGQDHLNYPSMVLMQTIGTTSAVFERRVTNVGKAGAIFTATVNVPSECGVNITVKPDKLEFQEANEIKSFTVELQSPLLKDESVISASLVWSHGPHTVRSPIFVYSYDVLSFKRH